MCCASPRCVRRQRDSAQVVNYDEKFVSEVSVLIDFVFVCLLPPLPLPVGEARSPLMFGNDARFTWTARGRSEILKLIQVTNLHQNHRHREVNIHCCLGRRHSGWKERQHWVTRRCRRHTAAARGGNELRMSRCRRQDAVMTITQLL